MDSRFAQPMPFGLMAAAVAAIALIGALFLFDGTRGIGGPERTPDPTPTSTPVPVLASQPAGELDAGTYALDIAAYGVELPRQLQFTVPGGWERFDGQLPAVIIDGAESPSGAALSFWTVDNLVADPCHPEDGLLEPPVGPGVDELADALRDVPGYTAGDAEPATIGGLEAVHVQLQAPADTSSCTDGNLKLWDTDGFQLGEGANQQDEIWIVDLDGVRLVVLAFTHPETPEDVRAALAAMVESIEFAER